MFFSTGKVLKKNFLIKQLYYTLLYNYGICYIGFIIKIQLDHQTNKNQVYILKIPKRVFSIDAFSVALKDNPRTFLVLAGLIIPSSQRRAEE